MSETIARVVIVGSGHAGIETAAALRQRGFDGSIAVIGDEPDLPYQRPPLSKEFLKDGHEGLPLKGEVFYGTNSIDLMLGQRAERIDRAAREVVLGNGRRLAYDHLVLATGATNRMPPIAGLDRRRVIELRTMADARRLNAGLAALGHMTVIGGGFIGLEVAALLRARDVAVDVVEAAPMLMGRVLSRTMSAYFREFHTATGTRLRLDTQARSIRHGDKRTEIDLSDGGTLTSDAVLVAAGVVPNMGLAVEAGLTTGNGIVVDEHLVTSDPAISAIGDCALYPNAYTGAAARLESVQNAVDQGRSVAARLTGEARPYDGFPWFWSHQGTAKLQIAGIGDGHDAAVTRGDPSSGKFSVFLYRADRLIAVESVNQAGEHMLARRLLSQGLSVDKAAAADPSADLKALLPKAGPA